MILPYDPTQDVVPPEHRAGNPRPSPDPASEGPARWTPFDPGDPPSIPPAQQERGPVVAIVASTGLVDVGWAVSVTVALARTWAVQRPGVVLVDTDLGRPRLHQGVDVDNAVGLAEVLEGSTTVSDATRIVEEDRLFCVPAGHGTRRLEDGFDPTRWARLCKAFSAAGATMVTYVPVEAPWLPTVLETATHVIELREQHVVLPWRRPEHIPLAAVLGPMSRILPAPACGHADGAGGEPPLEEEAGVGAVPAVHGPGAKASPRGGRTPYPWRRATLATLVVGVGAVAFVLAFRVGAEGWGAQNVDAPDAEMPALQATPATNGSAGPEGAALAARGPAPVAPTAAYSVQVAAFTDEVRAANHVAAYASALPSTPWTVVPVEVGGVVYHRVLAGLVPDSASARALAGRLAQVGALSGTTGIVRETHFVYDFGLTPTLEEGRVLATRLRAQGVLAEPARVQYEDHSVRFHIYAGGFANLREAEYLGSRIAAMGMQADLSPRFGLPPN